MSNQSTWLQFLRAVQFRWPGLYLIPQKQHHLFFCLLLSTSYCVCRLWNLKQKDKIQIIENNGVWRNKITFSLILKEMVCTPLCSQAESCYQRAVERRVSNLWGPRKAFIPYSEIVSDHTALISRFEITITQVFKQ